MLEFIQAYGLWIALAGVFVAMHWFGRGCCGGGHRHGQGQPPQGNPGQGLNGQEARGSAQKPDKSCH